MERESLLNKVDKMWSCRYERIRARAAARGDGEGEEEEETGSAVSADPTEDLEECVTRGSSTTLGAFSKLAKHIQCMYFNRQPPPDKVPTPTPTPTKTPTTKYILYINVIVLF